MAQMTKKQKEKTNGDKKRKFKEHRNNRHTTTCFFIVLIIASSRPEQRVLSPAVRVRKIARLVNTTKDGRGWNKYKLLLHNHSVTKRPSHPSAFKIWEEKTTTLWTCRLSPLFLPIHMDPSGSSPVQPAVYYWPWSSSTGTSSSGVRSLFKEEY